MIKKLYSIGYQIVKIAYYKICYNKELIVGKKFRFRDKLRINIKNGKIIIGNNVFFNHDCSLNSHGFISVGNNCIFGENVKIYDHNHKFRNKDIPIQDQDFSIGKIIIGDNCWIGSNVVLLKGTKIGKHCIVGAGCVVSGEIPDNTILKCCQNNYILEKIKL